MAAKATRSVQSSVMPSRSNPRAPRPRRYCRSAGHIVLPATALFQESSKSIPLRPERHITPRHLRSAN
jgi:hypothetical protein